MTRLYTYIVKVDSGLAPNPFWNWCTLAVCTPNHQGASVKPGDWIAGFSSKNTGHKFIYAMEVCERLHMKDYFSDLRFQAKKPQINGSWQQKCGDNIYNLDKEKWIALPNSYHQGLEEKDTRCPYVFVGQRYWYLGDERAVTPSEFLSMIGGRGVRVNHPPELTQQFKIWVQENFNEGVTAMPFDADMRANCIPNNGNNSPLCTTCHRQQ